MAECISSENISESSSKPSSDMQSCQEVNTEKVMEPIFLEEVEWNSNELNSTYSNLMITLNKQELSKSEFLVVCIYIFMLEYGFIPQEKEDCYEDACGFSLKRLKELINFHGWKKIDDCSYSLSLILPQCPIYVCKILCVKIGEDLIVNSVVKNIENAKHTLMLDILYYFTDSIHTKAHVNKIQNLKQLSKLFKSEVAFPFKHLILRNSDFRHACFENMPSEIILIIYKYLHGTDVMRLARTSKFFHSFIENEKFWKNLICKDFRINPVKFAYGDEKSYKDLMKRYGSLYKNRIAKMKPRIRTYMDIASSIM